MVASHALTVRTPCTSLDGVTTTCNRGGLSSPAHADYKLEAGVDEDGDPVITTVLLWIRPEGVAPAREEEKDEKDFQKGCACVIS